MNVHFDSDRLILYLWIIYLYLNKWIIQLKDRIEQGVIVSREWRVWQKFRKIGLVHKLLFYQMSKYTNQWITGKYCGYTHPSPTTTHLIACIPYNSWMSRIREIKPEIKQFKYYNKFIGLPNNICLLPPLRPGSNYLICAAFVI